MVPGGGISKELSAGKAEKVLAGIEPEAAVASARYQLAEAFIDDLRRIDDWSALGLVETRLLGTGLQSFDV
jgi:hypothetical protein